MTVLGGRGGCDASSTYNIQSDVLDDDSGDEFVGIGDFLRFVTPVNF
jgi:hypothetical protein